MNASAPRHEGTDHLFSDVRILDLSWVGVGPIVMRYFADHGATVVRVESTSRPDVLRTVGPWKDGVQGINRSEFFANFNTNKLGITLNLRHPKAVRVVERLVKWADVVAESFRPGTLDALGFGYRDLVRWKSDIILFSTSMHGQTGPYSGYAGYGNQGAAIAGVHGLTGWPDRTPCGPYGAYTDFTSTRLGALAVAAALDYRRRTGRGMHIDLSQVEASIQFLSPLVLERTAGGRPPARRGNRSRHCAPHGAFPCSGSDRWIAIAVTAHREWEGLCTVLGRTEWLEEPRFKTVEARLQHVDELEASIAEVTAPWDAYRLMTALQEAGVPAGVVQKPSDLFRDPQLAHRGHFWFLDHTEAGRCAYDGPAFRLSATPAVPRFAAPCLGQHNQHVYLNIAGLTPEAYAEAQREGLFE